MIYYLYSLHEIEKVISLITSLLALFREGGGGGLLLSLYHKLIHLILICFVFVHFTFYVFSVVLPLLNHFLIVP